MMFDTTAYHGSTGVMPWQFAPQGAFGGQLGPYGQYTPQSVFGTPPGPYGPYAPPPGPVISGWPWQGQIGGPAIPPLAFLSPQGQLGVQLGQHGPAIGQALPQLAAYLTPQGVSGAGLPHLGAPLMAPTAFLAPQGAFGGQIGPYGPYGQTIGGWTGQPPQLGAAGIPVTVILTPQGALGGQLGPYGQPVGQAICGVLAYPQFGTQMTAPIMAPQAVFGPLLGQHAHAIGAFGPRGFGGGGSFVPLHAGPQMAYAG